MSNISAKIININEVIKKHLSIPDYQRPYCWEESNVRLLLQDIFDSWKSGKISYRIGSIILYQEKRESAELMIVDGQQRITTILLILRQLGSDLGKSLGSKLTYKHGNAKKNIRQNFLFIKNWINENIIDKDSFCKYLTDNCEFVIIIVDDLSEAFQMFDSQNGRGKELEAYNLLKAYHIRAMNSETQETKIECDKKWESATKFRKIPNVDDEIDLLKQIFEEQLYRTRIWSKTEDADRFTKANIPEFKGITIDKLHKTNYPFQNNLLVQFFITKYLDSMDLYIKGVKNRFQNGDSDNINPFVTINQSIINGKAFFDYIETYIQIYKQLFILDLANEPLLTFKNFYKDYCIDYDGSNNNGDRYLRELYKSLIFLMFDKYGENGVNNYYKILYALVYRKRLENSQVKYKTVANYPKEFFSTIERSRDYTDLKLLDKKAKEKITCKKVVKKIVIFFTDFGTLIESVDSTIQLELDNLEYKKI
jgi:hypothetical protein